MELARRPLAREEDLIVEELGDELLVYDTKVDRGHSLSAVAARVWQACDGRTPVEGLCAQLDLDADEVGRAVDELDGCNLLEGTPELSIDELSDDEAVAGHTRRELSVKVMKVGGAVAAAPLIASIAAPRAEAALTIVPGCEAIFDCLFDCGNVDHGCQGTGCCCCQLPRIRCIGAGTICNTPGHPNFGLKVFRVSDVKFCGPTTAAAPRVCNQDICPPLDNSKCLCTTPCPGQPGGRQSAGPIRRDPVADQSSRPRRRRAASRRRRHRRPRRRRRPRRPRRRPPRARPRRRRRRRPGLPLRQRPRRRLPRLRHPPHRPRRRRPPRRPTANR